MRYRVVLDVETSEPPNANGSLIEYPHLAMVAHNIDNAFIHYAGNNYNSAFIRVTVIKVESTEEGFANVISR